MYEKKRMKSELRHLRGRLLSSAQGRVLELGVGAGANFPFYRREVELTAVDFSPAMLEKARAANDLLYGLQTTFIEADVDTPSLPEQSFDTVVSTLSLGLKKRSAICRVCCMSSGVVPPSANDLKSKGRRESVRGVLAKIKQPKVHRP